MMAEQNGVQGGNELDWLISPVAINALETPQCEYGAMAIEPILEQTPERGDKRADVRWPIRLEAPGRRVNRGRDEGDLFQGRIALEKRLSTALLQELVQVLRMKPALEKR